MKIIHTCICVSDSAIRLNLIQHCQSTILQIKKKKKDIQAPIHSSTIYNTKTWKERMCLSTEDAVYIHNRVLLCQKE